MTGRPPVPEEFLADHPRVVRVCVAAVRGSAPREAGAEMLVAPSASCGTIGGGQLEALAIEAARRMLAEGRAQGHLSVPLGPDIGQCCGGRVELDLTLLDTETRAEIAERLKGAASMRPHVLILGAGHVGRALAAGLALLPVRTILIDSRDDQLALAPHGIDRRLTALPEAEIRAAPRQSAFVILTHDHGLDFALAAEALARGDAAYVGMIGSASKRAACARHLREQGLSDTGLTCPIGAAGRGDKRPAVIAAFAAAEIMAALSTG